MKKRTKRTPRNLDSEGQYVDDIDDTLYLPVADLSAESPLRLQGNLTGIPRKLKDVSADWYNALAKWRKLSSDGLKICNTIGNVKIEHFDEQVKLPLTLLPLCDQLRDVIASLSTLVGKMQKWNESMQGISDLLAIKGKEDDVIFQTWTIENFIKHANDLYTMFNKELSLKRSISENICHAADRSEVLFMLTAWTHEPYIDEQVLLYINAMTMETGHTDS